MKKMLNIMQYTFATLAGLCFVGGVAILAGEEY